MVQCNLQNFHKICKSLDVPDAKAKDVKKISVLGQNTYDESVSGFGSSLIAIVKKANKQQLLGSSLEEQALVRQWLEYAVAAVNYVDRLQVSRQVLKVLNSSLGASTFVAGNSQSLADIVLYHLLYTTVSNLTFQEKEQFMHLSRWYGHLQQDSKIRGSNSSIVFSRTVLY